MNNNSNKNDDRSRSHQESTNTHHAARVHIAHLPMLQLEKRKRRKKKENVGNDLMEPTYAFGTQTGIWNTFRSSQRPTKKNDVCDHISTVSEEGATAAVVRVSPCAACVSYSSYLRSTDMPPIHLSGPGCSLRVVDAVKNPPLFFFQTRVFPPMTQRVR